MKRLFFQLIFIIVPSVMISACDNPQQAQKKEDTAIAAPKDDDCLEQGTSDSHQLDTIAAQGCPIK